MTVDRLIPEVDKRIDSLMPGTGITAPLYGMLRYHLGWVDEELKPVTADTGKRVRARLCLLACEAAGGDAQVAVAPAAAVELIHNFSLIHDDIQDRSEYRRHRRTVWSIWGDAQGINAGDDMFVLAQLALLSDEASKPEVVVRAVRALNEACRLLCEGQFLDLDFEQRPAVSVSDYYAVIERKTAALLQAACELGAIYGQANESSVRAVGDYGKQLGLAFQIRDDYLGIWGDPRETGKPAADDVERKKKTLPLLYALQKAAPADRAVLQEILARPGLADKDEVAKVLEVLDRCGAAAHTAAEAERHSNLALEALSLAGAESPARSELEALCRKLAGRAS